MPEQRAATCLNTSTIRNCGLSLDATIELVARTGYDGIELWVDEIESYLSAGGTLVLLRELLVKHSLGLPNLIAFFEWANPDDNERMQALDAARALFDMADALGSTFVAAPPFGVSERDDIPAEELARFYADLLDATASYNAQPLLEFWGHSRTLGALSEAMRVAELVGTDRVRLLVDVFHMAKTEGSWRLLQRLEGAQLGLFHINDYPSAADIRRLTDAERVYPGDGVAPLVEILETLRAIGYQGMLSLELFNEEYEKAGAEVVATTGLTKVRQCLARE